MPKTLCKKAKIRGRRAVGIEIEIERERERGRDRGREREGDRTGSRSVPGAWSQAPLRSRGQEQCYGQRYSERSRRRRRQS